MSAAIWAALAASLITACASLGVVGFQERLRSRRAGTDALHAAVANMLARSASILLRAGTMRSAAHMRSGLAEGLDVALHVQRPLDHFAFHDWLGQDWSPLNQAWAEIWMRGDQALIRLANSVVSASADVLGISSVPQGQGVVRKIVRWLWRPATLPPLSEPQEGAIHALVTARRDLGDYARKRFGKQAVSLFASVGESSRGRLEPDPDRAQPATVGGESETGMESESIAMLVEEARSQVSLQSANSDGHVTKALAFLGGDVAIAIALVSLHSFSPTTSAGRTAFLGSYWWMPLVALGVAAVAFGVAVWNRTFMLGPAPDTFYEAHIRDHLLSARLALLSDLNHVLASNERPLAWKRRCVVGGVTLSALAVAAIVAFGVVIH